MSLIDLIPFNATVDGTPMSSYFFVVPFLIIRYGFSYGADAGRRGATLLLHFFSGSFIVWIMLTFSRIISMGRMCGWKLTEDKELRIWWGSHITFFCWFLDTDTVDKSPRINVNLACTRNSFCFRQASGEYPAMNGCGSYARTVNSGTLAS